MLDLYTCLSIAVIAFVPAMLRFLPFLLFDGKRKTPERIEKLGKVLPYAIMGMLVVYCLKDISFISVSTCLPQLIACMIVGILYVWKRNTLISIVCGTVCYMLLVQLVF